MNYEVFLSLPKVIFVTPAAARHIDVLCILHDVEMADVLLTCLDANFRHIRPELTNLSNFDGGAFFTDVVGLVVMSLALPPEFQHRLVIVSEHEGKEARMDIEDWMNHNHHKFTRFEHGKV